MKNSLLYHRVNPIFVNDVLDCGILRVSKTLDGEFAVCLTRNVVYMSRSRPFVIVFDRCKLLNNFKVTPCCVISKLKENRPSVYNKFSKRYPHGFESEERVYSDLYLKDALWFGSLKVGCYDYRDNDLVFKNY